MSFISLPHARGGVSSTGTAESGIIGSSPRPWGCFSVKEKIKAAFDVFPTPVGVFLVVYAVPVLPSGLPHTRGGVSGTVFYASKNGMSSPHPWGCFYCG